MKSDPVAPADPLNLLRQQLILAQVRIMELEDVRDELMPNLASLEAQLTAAQTLADRKVEEAAHLERVRAGLQEQYEHMRHMQHVTNEALIAARSEAAALATREKDLLSALNQLQQHADGLAEAQRQHLGRINTLEQELTAAQAESAARRERINQLDAEQRALKDSRSWRWTAWLRSLERRLGGKS